MNLGSLPVKKRGLGKKEGVGAFYVGGEGGWYHNAHYVRLILLIQMKEAVSMNYDSSTSI